MNDQRTCGSFRGEAAVRGKSLQRTGMHSQDTVALLPARQHGGSGSTPTGDEHQFLR